MQTYTGEEQSTTERKRERHAREDALDASEFERLLRAVDDVDPEYQATCHWIAIAAGRLGMRGGEICHMRRDWIDWEEQWIEIPSHDPCDFGVNGGVCGYCRDRAREYGETHGVDPEIELDRRWNPKTDNSARKVPFHFDSQLQAAVEAFWGDGRVEFPKSRSTVNRRVNRLLRAAGWTEERCYPHALRASAAMEHAYVGVPPAALMAFFGWESLEIANDYIGAAGMRTADAFAEAHG